ncbi:hypothetical protein GCM10008927_21250 [Amylibacter ulvae]|uniref:Histidine kinase n=1 Tax=Paramylibacter ulvae TaxID=1651968 RepID=A0ABQ3D4B3_9RHOB|nr:DUF6446 family protein [Amylibacter ulvae]GHA55128.1 hypothetical protein GCM10008927_21250 [Amylibacter ulvae]
MRGTVLIGGILAVAGAMGAGLWYSQNYAYYKTVDGVTSVTAYGDAFPVSDYRGIDADTSPLKMRACFTVDWDYFPTDEFKDVVTPLKPPRWFDCFNAKQIADDIANDNATTILSDENVPFGFNTYIAQYPDGRAYMWRQINECGHAVFDGADLPDGCPNPNAAKPIPTTPSDVNIALSPIGGTPEDIAISDAMGVAAGDDFWACFKVDMSFAFLSETYQIVEEVAPTPTDLSCFNAETVANDVHSGVALAVMGQKNITTGVDRLVAIYEDGRAYSWHQKAAE